MPLSPNEIRDRAISFAERWSEDTSEKSEAQTFWNEFFFVYGIDRKRVATFEKRVTRITSLLEDKKTSGYIDLFWPGVLVAEHKSKGENLDSALQQALDYTDALKKRDIPSYILVSDFSRIRLIDLDSAKEYEVNLSELYKHIDLFDFIAGYTPRQIREEDPVNIKAAEKMGALYDSLQENGYEGHDLKLLLVRLLFCLFADDSTIFEPQGCLQDYLEDNTSEDGHDLGSSLIYIFQILNTPISKRQRNIDERLINLPYVNGKLFDEVISIPAFHSRSREALLDCCGLDWSTISPAIFGSLFQSVMDAEARRNLGAHYTTEENILKVIGPLFLDKLWVEFDKSKSSKKKLFDLQKKISSLNFLDPACGCGNFLVVAYREIRRLELEILKIILKEEKDSGQKHADISMLIMTNVDQFYGIEIEEFPAQIAQVALWLTDHQMNLEVSKYFGEYFNRLPLTHTPTIVIANAIRIDWQDVIDVRSVNYIFGNPPFVGKHKQKKHHKDDISGLMNMNSYGVLDYVCCWYVKTRDYLCSADEDTKKRVSVAFVSTNSITQGEQVGVLWKELTTSGIHINFAHRTFQWSSEARGQAAVQCVIIGFSFVDEEVKRLFDYSDPKKDHSEINVKHINPYLLDFKDIFIEKRRRSVSNIPPILYGSKPVDGGNLIFDDETKTNYLAQEPDIEKYIRPFMGADELLYNTRRWCFWLKDCHPGDIKKSNILYQAVADVRAFRQKSTKAATRALAEFPYLFAEDRQPDSDYLALPEVSSERRQYLPIAYVHSDVIASNRVYKIENANLLLFGFLCSKMHFVWMSNTSGRMESRFLYSSSLTYNTYPWPATISSALKKKVSTAAEAVLSERAKYESLCLAELYDPVAMPASLRKAHISLDSVVDSCYGKRKFSTEAERLSYLFNLYQSIHS
ncbi:MAG: class I SAM-dependent DNA methyltransferase [Gammaproteobacteria bacterium]